MLWGCFFFFLLPLPLGCPPWGLWSPPLDDDPRLEGETREGVAAEEEEEEPYLLRELVEGFPADEEEDLLRAPFVPNLEEEKARV